MKIIFAGTPEFAVPALKGLINAGHDIVMVLTQPDRPAGRGMKLKASPIKQLAESHDLFVYQPASLKPEDVQANLAEVNADAMIVAAYGLIIPTAILEMPTLGCYNIHGSLLPRWRGAAPIHRAILAGDQETGVTIMKVVAKLDAGDMISKGVLPITEDDTTQTLHDAISQLGAEMMVDAMAALARDRELVAEVQDESLVTYAHKLEKSESAIDWQQSAEVIARQVRAFNPFPVATATLREQTCRLWFAKAKEGNIGEEAKAGEIVALDQAIVVQCGSGQLHIHECQWPGAKRQSAQQFIQSKHLQVGECFC